MKNLSPLFLLFPFSLLSIAQLKNLKERNTEDPSFCSTGEFLDLFGVFQNANYILCGNGIDYLIFNEKDPMKPLNFRINTSLNIAYVLSATLFLFSSSDSPNELFQFTNNKINQLENWSYTTLTCNSYEGKLYCLIQNNKQIGLGVYKSEQEINQYPLSSNQYPTFPQFVMKAINERQFVVCYIEQDTTYCGIEEIGKEKVEYSIVSYLFIKLLAADFQEDSSLIIAGQYTNEITQEIGIAVIAMSNEGLVTEKLKIDKSIEHLTFAHQAKLVDLVSFIYLEDQIDKMGKAFLFSCRDIKIGSNIPISLSMSEYLEGIETTITFDLFSSDNVLQQNGNNLITNQAYDTKDPISTSNPIDDFTALYHFSDSSSSCALTIYFCFTNCETCAVKGNAKENKCNSCSKNYFPSIKSGNCELLSQGKYVNGEGIIQSCPISCNTCSETDGIVKCLSCKEPMKYLTEDGNCRENCPFSATPDNKCIKKCPGDLVFQHEECSPCNLPSNIYYEEACYQKCPSSTFNYNNKCQIKCPLGTFSSSLELACKACPANQVFFQDHCLEFCPEGYSTTGTDVLICKKCQDPESYYYQGKCYSACPNNPESLSVICEECKGFITQDNYNCIDKCPNDFNKYNQCIINNPLPEVDPHYPISFNHNPFLNINNEISYFKGLTPEEQKKNVEDLAQKILSSRDVFDNYDYTILKLTDLMLFYQIASISGLKPTIEFNLMVETVNKKTLEFISSTDSQSLCSYLGDEMQMLSLLLFYCSLNNKANPSNSFDTLYQLSSAYLEKHIARINTLDKEIENPKVYEEYLNDVLSGTSSSVSKQIEILQEVPNTDFKPEDAASPKYQMTYAIITKESHLKFKTLIEKIAETYTQLNKTQAGKTPNFELTNTLIEDSFSSQGIVQSNCDLTNYNNVIAKMKELNLNKLICLPNNILSQYPSLEAGSVGVIDYSLYPLLNKNISALSNEFLSIRLFSKENEYVPLKKLSEPITIIMLKPNSSYNECIFYNDELKTPNNTDCTSVNIEPYLICSCTHLTDFSLSMFHPLNIFKDIVKLFEQARFITSFEAFKYLNASNATILYLFSAILLLLLIGMFFTIKSDLKTHEDWFVLMIDKESPCCSNEDVEEEIAELREKTLNLIMKRQEIVRKYFHGEGKNNQEKNQRILSKFNIIIKPSEEQSIEMKENKNGQNDYVIVDTMRIVDEDELNQNRNLIENPSEQRNSADNDQNQEETIEEKEKEQNEDKSKGKKHSFASLINTKAVSSFNNQPENKEKEGDDIDNVVTSSNEGKTPLISKEVEDDKAPLVNHWFLRLCYVFKEFFLNEYRVCVILLNKEQVYTKTNIFILTAIRLIAAISICALFSKCVPIGTDDEEIEKGFSNRNFAVSILTILIMEIPFTFIEILLLKAKIPQKKIDQKDKIRRQKKIIHIAIYIFFVSLFVCCLINTTWVSLDSYKNNFSCDFMEDFMLSTLFDYACYDVIIITVKSLLYSFLIKAEKRNYCQICLISVIAALPWAFAIQA